MADHTIPVPARHDLLRAVDALFRDYETHDDTVMFLMRIADRPAPVEVPK